MPHPPSTPDPAAIRRDLMTIVGGSFTSKSLGREEYEAIRERALAAAPAMLDAFEEQFLGLRFDAEIHSRLYLVSFLALIAPAARERVRSIAEHLRRQYDTVLVVFDQITDRARLEELVPQATADLLLRLADRRSDLAHLLANS